MLAYGGLSVTGLTFVMYVLFVPLILPLGQNCVYDRVVWVGLRVFFNVQASFQVLGAFCLEQDVGKGCL